VAVRGSETKRNTGALILCALIPASLWVCAMKTIGDTKGFHSTPGIWTGLIGLPGDMLGVWVGQLTNSDTVFYIGSFVGIWLFWLGFITAILAIKHRLARSGGNRH
jgi:hypothetical protein